MLERGAEFEALHRDVDMEFLYVPGGELVATLMRQTMVGELPDIVFADNPDVPHLAAAGTYLDITPLVEKWGQWDDFFVGSRLAGTLEGKVYAVHFGTNNIALYYNKGYFESLGIVPPKTWQELLDTCRILTDKIGGDGVYAIGFSAIDDEGMTWQFEPFLWSNGGSLLELGQPEAIEALQLWTALYQEGYAHPDVLMWGQGGDPVDRFIAGDLAMLICGPWILPQLRGKVNYGIASLPVPTEGITLLVPGGGETFGLSANIDPAKVDIACEFIKFFTSTENMAELAVPYFAGFVPTRQSAIPLVLQQDPELEVFAEQAKRAVPRPPMAGNELYPEVSAVMRRYIQLAMTGQLTPEQAFWKANAEIRSLFATEEKYQAAVSEARETLAEVLSM